MTAKRIATIALGWAFLLLGVAGLVLPILQGILFIVIGLLILSTEYVWAHHLLRRLREKFPSAARRADRAGGRAQAWLRRIGPSGAKPEQKADSKPE
ncbi:MAG TPA: PGPGW domain-containing protein [Terriglobales bacterium]|nr:PGPGW domain-containing protein [Terriglobales bacterium]